MRRLLRLVAYPLLGLALLLLVAFLLRGRLLGARIAGGIERALVAELGGRFSIEAIEGSYLFDIAVVGLRTEEPPPGPLRRLDCARAVVRFDLRRLLAGEGLSAVESILASGVRVDLDPGRPAPGGGPLSREALSLRLPRLELSGDATVATPEGEVLAEGVGVQTAGVDRLAVHVRRLVLPARFGEPGRFAGTLELGGGRAVLTSESPVAGITPVRVAYDGTIDADLLVGGSPAYFRAARGEATLGSEALDLAALPPWVVALLPESIEPPAEGVATVEATVLSLDPLAVAVVGGADRLRWRDLDLRGVRLDLRHEAGRTLVRRAHAEGRGVLVDVSGAGIDTDLPYLVDAVGEAIVVVPDLRAIEPRLDRPLSLAARARGTGPRGILIEEFRVEGEGILLSARGEMTLPDDPARWREARLSGTCSGTVRDFAAGEYAFGGEVRLAGAIGGTAGAPEAELRVDGEGLAVAGRAVERVALVGRIDPGAVAIRDLRVEGEAGILRASGVLDPRARAIREGRYEVDVTDLEAFLRLFPGAPRVEGSVSGSGDLRSGPEGLLGTAELAAQGLRYEGREVGDLSVRATWTGRGIEVAEARAHGPWGSAEGTGAVLPGDRSARVEAATVEAGGVRAALARPCALRWGEGDLRIPAFEAAMLGGVVRGRLALLKGRTLEGQLRGEGLDLSQVEPGLGGRATVDLRFEGDSFEIAAQAPEVEVEGRRGEVSVAARSDLDGILVERLRVRAGDLLSADGSARLPWRFDGARFERVESVEPSLALEVRSHGAPGIRGIGAADVVATVRGVGRDLRVTARLRDLSVDGFALRGEIWVDLLGTPGRVAGTAALERSDLGEAEARVSADRGFDWTRPDEVEAALDAAAIEARLDLRVPDLGALRRFVPGLAELHGAADGALSIEGPLRAPAVTGAVHLAAVEARAEGSTPRLAKGRGVVVVEGRRARIREFEAELGHAPVGVTGVLDLPAGGPPRIDLALTGRNALLAADPFTRVRADFDVTLSGPPGGLRLAGSVRITDALYARPVNLLARGDAAAADELAFAYVRRGPLASADLDLEMTAKETIRVRTPSLRGDLSCDLRVRGRGEAPAPEGRVFFRDLLVELPASTGLKVDRGDLLFPVGEPFQPRIDAVAHTRLKGYDIDLRAEGPVRDVALRISTRPPLRQDDAMLLLLTGATREELEREGVEQAAIEKLGRLLGERLVSRVSGPRDPDERTFLDRFRFQVGAEVSRSGEDTIEAEFEASDRLFLRVERDRFDEYNGGVVWRLRFR